MRHRGCGGAQPFSGSHTLSRLLPHLHGVRPAVDPPPPLVPPSASLTPGSGCVFSSVTFWLLREKLAPLPLSVRENKNQTTRELEGSSPSPSSGSPAHACGSSMGQTSPTAHPPSLPLCPPASIQAAWGPAPALCSPLQLPEGPAPALAQGR